METVTVSMVTVMLYNDNFKHKHSFLLADS